MKNYSSRRANKGKTAYRTPSPIKYKLIVRNKYLKEKNRGRFS